MRIKKFIRNYKKIDSIAREIITDRIKNGTSEFRHEWVEGISNITMNGIRVSVIDTILDDDSYEYISWKEIKEWRFHKLLKLIFNS